MPLRCLNEHRQSLYAFAHDDRAWAALTAANRRDRHLRTICCDSAVAAKTSRLGTRFFAHIAGSGCATGDETPEHLHLKALAVAAAQARGWAAETEVAGTTPAGAPWRADVLATRGRHRVAVEIQWSAQPDDETRRRQARYAEAGVRGLWLFRQPGFAVSEAIPAVRVCGSLAKGFTALGLPVGEMLDAAFGGRLRFGLAVGVAARATVVGAVLACWKPACGALNRVVVGVEVVAGDNRCIVDLATIDPSLVAALLARLPRDGARGRIGPRAGAVANACFACAAPIGNAFVAAAKARHIVAGFDLAIDAGWAAAVAATTGFVPVWSVARARRSD